MSLSRRDFIKQAAAVSAAGAISMNIPPDAFTQANSDGLLEILNEGVE